MQYTKELVIAVNGKLVRATVTVDAPELDVAVDCVDARAILSAAANGQNMTIRSRHHKDRDAHIIVTQNHNPCRDIKIDYPPLKLVA